MSSLLDINRLAPVIASLLGRFLPVYQINGDGLKKKVNRQMAAK
jgi:hypothetical protein